MSDTITLTRAEYDALLDRIEDAEDIATLAVHRAREAAIGTEVARADYLPLAMVDRLMAGEHPVRIWREHRSLTQRDLAKNAGVSPGYLNEIEHGRKPGSMDTLAKLAKALGITIDDLLPWPKDEATR